VRVALVGAGNIAARYAECIVAEPELTLAGASDVLPGRAAELTDRFGGRAHDALADVLADDEVDAVVNLTAPAAHAEVTAAALDAGKHVHTEKPVALDGATARQLAALATARGVRLSCAPATLLGEAAQTMWRAVRTGELGEVRVAYAEANWGRLETWHPSPEGLYESGPLFDVGIYPLTIITAMFGPVRRVVGYGTTIQPERVRKDGTPFTIGTPDFQVAGLELDSGVVARITATFWVPPSRQRGLELHGTAGSMWMPDWAGFSSPLQRTSDGENWTDVPPVRPGYPGIDWARALVDLKEAIAAGRPHRMGPEHAAHVVDVITAVDQSRRAGGPVEVTSSFPAPEPMEWA
jgi:predicted dehydrogenase